MTEKEKAEELVGNYSRKLYLMDLSMSDKKVKHYSKEYALIAAHEGMSEAVRCQNYKNAKWWEEVIEEINKL